MNCLRSFRAMHVAAGLVAAGATSLAAAETTAPVAGAAHGTDAVVRTLPENAAQGAKSSTDESVAPIAALHARAARGLKRPYSGTPIDVATFHYDNLRTGWNGTETDLTTASVGGSGFGLLKTLSVDGSVFAQPLLISGFKFPDGSVHDVLLVTTAHDSVYAFDAQTYDSLWHVSLGTSQSTKDVGCTDVTPEYGVMSTPVIRRTAAGSASVYLVAATEPSRNSFHTQLHVLDLATGADLQAPVEISPSATLSNGSKLKFDSQNQWSRAGMTLTSKGVYVAIGSHCDSRAGKISGWLLHYNLGLQLEDSFNTIETPAGLELASIWEGGFAPAADDDGTIFAVTGNGNFAKGGKDWGESVLHLPANLKKVQDFFTPATYGPLNDDDLDFGSGGVMLLPVQAGQAAPPMAVALGKDAVLYLLDRGHLGKVKKNDAGALQSTRLARTGHGLWGGPATYTGPAGQVVFYQLNHGPMRAFSVNSGATPSITQFAEGTTDSGGGGSTPTVSSNGKTAGTGIVWTVRRGNPITLEAYDASTLGAPIFSASAGAWTAGNAFVTPTEANGRVYVGGAGTVTVFGLTE